MEHARDNRSINPDGPAIAPGLARYATVTVDMAANVNGRSQSASHFLGCRIRRYDTGAMITSSMWHRHTRLLIFDIITTLIAANAVGRLSPISVMCSFLTYLSSFTSLNELECTFTE